MPDAVASASAGGFLLLLGHRRSPQLLLLAKAGFCLLSVVAAAYFALWLLAVPFIPADSQLRQLLFPPPVYAVALPVLLFWTLTLMAFVHVQFGFR